jgi:hypothetical protein
MPEVAVYTKNGSLEYTFFPFPLEFRGGVEIAVGDIDVNGRPEIYVTSQTAGGPQIRIFDNERSLLGSFFTFESSNRYGGYIAIQYYASIPVSFFSCCVTFAQYDTRVYASSCADTG